MSVLARRAMLASAAATAALAAAPRALAAPSALSPEDATDRFVRMRCNLPGQWGVWVYRGWLLVQPQGERARALCRIEGMSFNRATRRPEGGWGYELDEAGYFCGEDGRPLDRLDNPFTGTAVAPRHYRSPQRLVFAAQQVMPAATLPPGIAFTGRITDAIELGGQVFASEDLFVSTPPRPATADAPARPARVQTSLAMFAARAADLARPGWVPATAHYGTMNGFVDWLGMAGIPGVQNMRLVMAKSRSAEAAPAWLRARIAADHPGFLDRA
jgi:hypothetical protein